MSTSLPGRHCRNRLFEWTAAGALLGVGMLQLIWPDAFPRSKLQFLLDVLGTTTLTVLCIITGWARAVALFTNGRCPVIGPCVRTITAISSAFMWTQMGVSLVLIQLARGEPPSPSVPLYIALVCAELFSTYRAASDVRYR